MDSKRLAVGSLALPALAAHPPRPFVGAAVAFLASDAARWVNGETLPFDGGSKLSLGRGPAPRAQPQRASGQAGPSLSAT
jgi:hypothetical protein